jgi:hypothetical protein
MRRPCIYLAFVCVTMLGAGAAVTAAPSLSVVALSGDPTPDELDTFEFSTGDAVVLDDTGKVVLAIDLFGSGNRDDGIYRGDLGGFTEYARSLDPTPGGDTFGTLDSSTGFGGLSAVNASGLVAFNATVDPPSNPTAGEDALFTSDGSVIQQVVRQGDAVPGNGDVVSLARSRPSINTGGQVSFAAGLTNTTLGTADDQAIYRWDGVGSGLTQIVREGQAAPNGGTLLGAGPGGGFVQTTVNTNGKVVFQALVDGTAQPGDNGIFVGDGTTITQYARAGTAVAGGALGGLSTPAFNDVDRAAFVVNYEGTSSSLDAVFRSDGNTLTEIASAGNLVPDGDGTYRLFNQFVDINNSNEVGFIGSITPAVGNTGIDKALFRSDGSNDLIIARTGTPAPGGGEFDSVLNQEFAMNDDGQIVFGALVDTTPGVAGGVTSGLYFFDDTQGLFEIVRIGDPLLGSTINVIEFTGNWNAGTHIPIESSGINNAGQAAFYFRTVDLQEGVIIWSLDGPPLVGDLDGDGFVGITDLNIVLGNWNQNVPPADPLADPSGDGFVGIEDLNTVLGNWNAGTPPGAGANIPEPGTAVVLGLGPLAVVRRGVS